MDIPSDTTRNKMNGKPVHFVDARSVLNLKSGFVHKLLCDGPTFSTGSACAYSCAFCYVPSAMAKSNHMDGLDEGQGHADVVVRRSNALNKLRSQLTLANGKARFPDVNDTRVVFSSPLVDVAANMDLVRETIEACRLILELTNWQIRLLSKSNLLPKIAEALSDYRSRVIYGVSTGTLDDGLAKAFEQGTPLVSKRLASLHWLQDNDFRTYGMICPSLPMAGLDDYLAFGRDCADAIRADKCEHVWAEVINVRGESMRRTVDSLREAGYADEADRLLDVSTDTAAWEDYNKATFLGHLESYRGNLDKLRFLTYTKKDTIDWWSKHRNVGAVLLGRAAEASM